MVPTSCLSSLLLTLHIAHPATVEWVRVLPGDFSRLWAGQHAVVARSGQTYRVVDEAGSIHSLRLPVQEETPMVFPKNQSAARILEDAGFRDIDRDSPSAVRYLENELSFHDRKRVPDPNPAEKLHPVEFAWNDEQLFIMTRKGIFAWEPGGTRVIYSRPLPPPFVLAAQNGEWVLGAGLHLSRLDEFGSETSLPRLREPVRKVLLSQEGTLVVWHGGNLVTIFSSTGDERQLEFPLPFQDIASCAGRILVAGPQGLHMLTEAGATEPLPLSVPIRRILCSDGAKAPWAAVGKDLSFSVDDGTEWQVISLPSYLKIRDMAATENGAWIASTQGIYFTPWVAGMPTPAPRVHEPDFRRRKAVITPFWSSYLPTLTVHGQYRSAPSKRDIRTMVLATFPLDRPPPAVIVNQEIPLPIAERGAGDERSEQNFAFDIHRELPCLAAIQRKVTETFLVEPARARSYLRRAAHAAWLPELRIMVDRRFGRSESLDYVPSSAVLSSPLGVDTVNDIRYEARATWDLSRLVFAPEEMAAQNQALRMADQRREIESTLHRLFFERQRLRYAKGASEASGMRSSLRLIEVTTELDLLSENAFSQCLSEQRKGME